MSSYNSLLSNTLPEITKDINDFVNLGSADDKTYYNFSILSTIADGYNSNFVYSENNIIYDYLDELKNNCIEVYLDDNDYIKYRYNPKLLAYDIYGSSELFFIILALNGMCNIKDFNKRKIKMLHKSVLNTYLESIYNAESSYIQKNRAKNNL